MTNIVMLTKNRVRLFEQALRSLKEHTPYGSYNLTVVDDDSLDGDAVAYAMGGQDQLLRVAGRRLPIAQLKSLGVEASRIVFGEGDWLYLSDNDVYFKQGWLDDLIRCAELTAPYGYALWGGQVHPYHHAVDIFLDTRGQLRATEHISIDGPSWLMEWSTWEEFGPLRGSTPGACQGEDVDFCDRLRGAGNKLAAISPHVVVHTGFTQTDGKEAPGCDLRRAAEPVPGVIYE